MFGWLADLLIKSSVVGSSCPCCSAQNEQLKQMQKAVLNGELSVDVQDENYLCHHCQCQCGNERECHSHEKAQTDMKVKYHYKI